MEFPTIRDPYLEVSRTRTPAVWVDVEVLPVYRDYCMQAERIGDILGLYWDNGKENGNHYTGVT